MSVSFDDDVAEGGEQARDVLAGWLDDYSEGRCDLEDMQASFLSVCRSDPDAPWDALALLDQYTRRRRIQPELAQSLKSDIQKLVFGEGAKTAARSAPGERSAAAAPASLVHEEPAPDPEPIRAPIRAQRMGAPDAATSDAHWRKIPAERDAQSTRPGTAFIDRTLLRNEPALQSGEVVRARPPLLQPFAPAARDDAPGRRVLRERYELLAVIGGSSSGTVYRAVDRRRTHLSGPQRCVAVKVLNADYAGRPAALAELEREFHEAQSLSHPNIVNVFDLDRDGDAYFIVMELLEGELLSSILQKLMGRPMRREHALAIVAGVGAALEHAHRRAIVHGDLKPGSVMLTTSGEVRVLDFGFARHRAFDLHTASAFHETPAPSPAYASVERVNGSEPDLSDDVYSLACIAYELLTGRHPFDGRSALLARAHGRRPPRVRSLDRQGWRVLRHALLWTRGERRTDVAALLAALGCGNASSVRTTPDDVLEPQDAGLRWLRVAAWTACLIVAAIAGFYVLPQFSLPDIASLIDSRSVPPAAEEEEQTRPAPDSQEATSDAAARPDAPARVAAPSDAGEAEAQKAAATPGSTKRSAAAGAPAAGATIGFHQDTYVVNESDGAVRLRIRRTGSTRQPVAFTWSLTGNSAEAGADFAAIGPGSETIPAGAREIALTIPLVSDSLTENTELFLVELATNEEAVAGRSHAAVIVVDDD